MKVGRIKVGSTLIWTVILLASLSNIRSLPQTAAVLSLDGYPLRELVSETIVSLRHYDLIGQYFAAAAELSAVGRVDGRRLAEALVPGYVYGLQGHRSVRNVSLCSSRRASPLLAHVNALRAPRERGGFSSGKNQKYQPEPHWALAHSLVFGRPQATLEGQEGLRSQDLFLNLQTHPIDFTRVSGHHHSKAEKFGAPWFIVPRHIIWIRVEHRAVPAHLPKAQPYVHNSNSSDNFWRTIWRVSGGAVVQRSTALGQSGAGAVIRVSCNENCLFSSATPEPKLAGSDDHDYLPCARRSGKVSPLTCIIRHIAPRISLPVIFTAEDDKSAPRGSLLVVKRDVTKMMGGSGLAALASDAKMGRGTHLLNSLVFLARKRFHSLRDALKPLNLISSVALVLASGTVAVLFALLKILTSSAGAEDSSSWYDYLMQQLLDIIHEIRHGKSGNVKDGSDAEEGAEDKDSLSARVESMRGKASKSVLYGTMQIVSFVLVAIYEGKLYSTITLPKPRLVSTLDELLTSEKYRVKLTREAADVSLIVGANNYSSVLNRFSQTFNIQDCINWVERSLTHGCVAYEFELRSLPKSQRARLVEEQKIVVKPNKGSIFANSNNNVGIRSGRAALMHPAISVSKWILEAGFLQFWMVAENVFADNLLLGSSARATTAGSVHKMFCIKDYLGLLVVYVFLLFLAAVVFLSEVLAGRLRAFFQRRSWRELLQSFWGRLVVGRQRVLAGFVAVRTFFFLRRKRLVKVRRMVNNIV